MLKKEFRLKTNFEFNIPRKYGESFRGTYFYASVLKPQNYTGPSKMGIVVSNKFHKNAVVRNRIKRLFREIIRKDFDKVKDKGLWIVLHPKTTSMDKTYEELSADVNKTLQKIFIS